MTPAVDEAVLLSDRIALMTNGPAATIGEIIPVNLPRPRDRRTVTGMPEYHELKVRVLEFPYERYKAAS